MKQTTQQPEKQVVYISLDHGKVDETIAFADKLEDLGLTCFVVSADPSEDEKERFKGKKFIEGDIIAVIHQFNSPFSTLASLSTNPDLIYPKPNSAVFLSVLEEAYQVVTSISSIPMRVNFSSLFDKGKIYGVELVCADAEFWQKALSVHIRWRSEGFTSQNSTYMELLLNFCVSIYDIDVLMAESTNA